MMKLLRYLLHDRWVLIKWCKNNKPSRDLAENINRHYGLSGWVAKDVKHICDRRANSE